MAIDLWAAGSTGSDTYREAEKRYFELSKGVSEAIEANVETADTVKHTQSKVPKMRPGMISPYDDLFKRHAKSLGWDWRLLASIAYFESRFQPNVVAWRSEEHTSELQSHYDLVCRLLLEKKKRNKRLKHD